MKSQEMMCLTKMWYHNSAVTFVALHVIYVTWAGGICLICTHEPEGAQCPRASADISGKPRRHVIYVM